MYCFVGYVATQETPKLWLQLPWLALDIATEKVGAQGSEKEGFINLLEQTVKNLQENLKTALKLTNQANTAFKTSSELHITLQKQLQSLVDNFTQLKSNPNSTGDSNGGAAAVERGSPFKRQKVEGEDQPNS